MTGRTTAPEAIEAITLARGRRPRAADRLLAALDPKGYEREGPTRAS